MDLDAAVQAATSIDGWMQEDELHWLGEQAATHSLIVEIGSWHGRSTKVLALMTPGKVISVDNLDFDAAGWKDQQQDKHFDEHLASELAAGKVEKIRRASVDVAKRFRRRPDMLFVDGGHEEEDVTGDLEAWAHRVAPGGLLCGHDVTIPGVQVALTKVLGGDAWRRIGAGSLWEATA